MSRAARKVWRRFAGSAWFLVAGSIGGFTLGRTIEAGNAWASIGVAVALVLLGFSWLFPRRHTRREPGYEELMDRLEESLSRVPQGVHLTTEAGDLLLVYRALGRWIIARVVGESFAEARAEFAAGASITTVRRETFYFQPGAYLHCQTKFVPSVMEPGGSPVPVEGELTEPTPKDVLASVRMKQGGVTVEELATLVVQLDVARPIKPQ